MYFSVTWRHKVQMFLLPAALQKPLKWWTFIRLLLWPVLELKVRDDLELFMLLRHWCRLLVKQAASRAESVPEFTAASTHWIVQHWMFKVCVAHAAATAIAVKSKRELLHLHQRGDPRRTIGFPPPPPPLQSGVTKRRQHGVRPFRLSEVVTARYSGKKPAGNWEIHQSWHVGFCLEGF